MKNDTRLMEWSEMKNDTRLMEWSGIEDQDTVSFLLTPSLLKPSNPGKHFMIEAIGISVLFPEGVKIGLVLSLYSISFTLPSTDLDASPYKQKNS
jgi:hypothetical protein